MKRMPRSPVYMLLTFLLMTAGAARAQWEMEDSHTTADLRGIDNVGGGVAWASGTNGTVLRTVDGGYLWQACAIPPGAKHLDFRGSAGVRCEYGDRDVERERRPFAAV